MIELIVIDLEYYISFIHARFFCLILKGFIGLSQRGCNQHIFYDKIQSL